MVNEPVLGTEELRRDLAKVLARMQTHPQETVTIGRQRRPEAVLVPIRRWQELTTSMPDRDRPGAPSDPDEPVPTTKAASGAATVADLHWDPRDGVAFEVAESVLGNLISFCVAELSALEQTAIPDQVEVAAWRDRLTDYARERKQLSISKPATLRSIIDHYGAELRELTNRSTQ